VFLGLLDEVGGLAIADNSGDMIVLFLKIIHPSEKRMRLVVMADNRQFANLKGRTFVAVSWSSIRMMVWAAWTPAAFIFLCPPAYAQTDAVVARNHPALSEAMTSSGSLEPTRTLSMSVTLALRNRDQLQQLLADLQNPESPEYHHFLTPDEFAARFGPTNFEAVRNWLISQSFKVIAINTATRVIQFTGTVAQAEHAFGVAIAVFGGASFGNISDPHVPARFAGMIGHIHGLDNMSARVPGLTRAQLKQVAPPSDSLESAYPPAANGDSVPGVTLPGVGGPLFGPSDFYTFYDEKPLLDARLRGSSCIAIAGASRFLPGAIALFNRKFKVGGSRIATVLVDRSNPGFNGDESEAELDLEWSHAVAPGAASRFYLGNDANAQIDAVVDAIGAAVSEDRCSAISISFGYCGEPDSFYTGILDPIFMQAAAQGQSVVTISHDYGAAYLTFDSPTQQCVAGTSRAVSELGADPNVTTLSGTSFNPSWDAKGNIIVGAPERVWNDPNDGMPTGGATGGGVSSIFTKPAFQSGPGVPADGMRDIPDVSLFASPDFPGAWVIISASCFNTTGCNGRGGLGFAQAGGTSLSAPSFAGIASLIGQAVGKPLGNMDPTIYTLANSDLVGSGFRDVTSGNNDFNGVTGFTAGPDYDQCTGWGSVDVTTFLTAYANAFIGPSVTLSPAMLTFKSVRSGTTSNPKLVTIALAKGQKAWTQVTSVAGSGVFTAAQTCVGHWIGPGRPCRFGVTFSPKSAGPAGPVMLTITDRAVNSPQTITLTGTGR
jgi:subtilase family serine protease